MATEEITESALPPVGREEVAAGERRASSRKRPKKSYGKWIAFGVLALLIALIGSTVGGSSFVYSRFVDEIMKPGEQEKWIGRTVRLEGMVSPASIEHRPGTNEFRFRVYRYDSSVQVHYRGVVPDTFRDCAGVTVRGELGRDGTFQADEIVAKCPSKYEAATVVNGQCVVGATPDRAPRAGATGGM